MAWTRAMRRQAATPVGVRLPEAPPTEETGDEAGVAVSEETTPPRQEPRSRRDPALPLRDPRCEAVCQALAGGATMRAALEQAGHDTAHPGQLLKSSGLRDRLEYLQRQQRSHIERATLVNAEYVTRQLLEVLDRCMAAVPVTRTDETGMRQEETGEWRFDARNALVALKLLGDKVGMWSGGAGNTLDPAEARRVACSQLVLLMLRDERAVRELAAALQPHEAVWRQLLTIWRAA